MCICPPPPLSQTNVIDIKGVDIHGGPDTDGRQTFYFLFSVSVGCGSDIQGREDAWGDTNSGNGHTGVKDTLEKDMHHM